VSSTTTGIVSVQSGTLSLDGGGVTAAPALFNTASGAFLDLDNMTFANSAASVARTWWIWAGKHDIKWTLTEPICIVAGAGRNEHAVGTLTWTEAAWRSADGGQQEVLNIVAAGNGFAVCVDQYGTVNWTTSLYGDRAKTRRFTTTVERAERRPVVADYDGPRASLTISGLSQVGG